MNSNYFGNIREEMQSFVPNNFDKVLEVGCGEGKFLESLKTRGKVMFGIEPDPFAAEIARKRLDHIFTGTFEDVFSEIENEKFDLIVFNDVLEHTIDPWKILRTCKQILSSRGVVVASIPNFVSFYDFFKLLLTQDFQYKEAGIFDRTHLRFFSKKSIQRMFAECGYSIEIIQGINPTTSYKFKLFDLLTFKRFGDMRYLQFGIRAKPL